MTDQAEPGRRQARAKPVDAARQWTRKAVLDLIRQSGGCTVTRLTFRDRPDVDMTTSDAEPIAGILAVRDLERAAREFTRGYVRQARQTATPGTRSARRSIWAVALPSCGVSLAEAAYDDSAGDPDGEYARRYSHTVAWTCPACRATVSDRGPSSGPADDEQGHADARDRRTGSPMGRDGIG
jgi:hypothetical protein